MYLVFSEFSLVEIDRRFTSALNSKAPVKRLSISTRLPRRYIVWVAEKASLNKLLLLYQTTRRKNPEDNHLEILSVSRFSISKLPLVFIKHKWLYTHTHGGGGGHGRRATAGDCVNLILINQVKQCMQYSFTQTMKLISKLITVLISHL
jgi:hypothetical protein